MLTTTTSGFKFSMSFFYHGMSGIKKFGVFSFSAWGFPIFSLIDAQGSILLFTVGSIWIIIWRTSFRSWAIVPLYQTEEKRFCNGHLLFVWEDTSASVADFGGNTLTHTHIIVAGRAFAGRYIIIPLRARTRPCLLYCISSWSAQGAEGLLQFFSRFCFSLAGWLDIYPFIPSYSLLYF